MNELKIGTCLTQKELLKTWCDQNSVVVVVLEKYGASATNNVLG